MKQTTNFYYLAIIVNKFKPNKMTNIKKIRKQLITRILILCIVGLFFNACEKDFPNSLIEEQQEEVIVNHSKSEGLIKLGKSLENPYSIDNMQIALDNLRSNAKTTFDDVDVTTTHLYVKFKPSNEDELAKLTSDSTLVLYDYPLDQEIDESGDYYHDPEIPQDQPTYQYCAVLADKQLPNKVDYEILAELFIPDEDKVDGSNKNSNESQAIEALVEEALRITNNLEDSTNKNNNAAENNRRGKWRPAGVIKVYDHETRSYVGVHGAQVRARRWFTTHKGYTDLTGKYSCNGRFKRKANYSIKWERYDFSVRSGTFGQAWYNGPKKKGNWNVNLGKSTSSVVNDAQQYYALIHQGAHDYYYGNRFELTSPPKNGFFKRQLKIAGRQKKGKSSYAKLRAILYFGADVSIQRWTLPSDEVYGMTIHELGHASHRVVDKNSYISLVLNAFNFFVSNSNKYEERILIETWSTAVEIVFTLHRYRNRFGLKNYNYLLHNYQQKPIKVDKDYGPAYTSAGYDMIDNVNQRSAYGNAYPQDRVSGYTIKQLETALKGAKSWSEWRDNIKRLYNNPTENYLNELFNNWIEEEGTPGASFTPIAIAENNSIQQNEPEVFESNPIDIEVQAKGNCGSEHMSMKINGELIKTWTDISKITKTYSYKYTGHTPIENIQIIFDNDTDDGCGRNLFVYKIEVGGTSYEVEKSATMHGGCGSANWLYCNGYFEFNNLNSESSNQTQESETLSSNSVDVEVFAKGNCGSERMTLKINGEVMKTWTDVSRLTKNYTFEYSGNNPIENIQVVFDNDTDVGCGRNLFVYKIEVDGTVYEVENSATMYGGCGSANWLYCNGYFEFKL